MINIVFAQTETAAGFGPRGLATASEPVRIHTLGFTRLDHDPGGCETGYGVPVYLVEHGNPVKHIKMQSCLSIGIPEMEAYVRKRFPKTELTFLPV